MDYFFSNIDQSLNNLLISLGMFGPILGGLLIIIESMVPVLPLCVFITLNFYVFGNLFGFFFSYILTVLGCNIAFYISKHFINKRIDILYDRYGKTRSKKLINKFSSMKLSTLSIIMAFPFTPAFLINILAGVSEMSQEKFLISSMIGKVFMVYFWGYIGMSLIDSLKNPIVLIRIIILLILAFIISKIINKKFDIE